MPTASYTGSSLSTPQSLVSVSSPKPHDVLVSPVTVSGKAPGYWFSEGSLPIVLLDGKGNEIASTTAQADGEWMTEDLVPFTATLEFSQKSMKATLLIKKDNPSGEPVNDASFSLQVSL